MAAKRNLNPNFVVGPSLLKVLFQSLPQTAYLYSHGCVSLWVEILLSPQYFNSNPEFAQFGIALPPEIEQ